MEHLMRPYRVQKWGVATALFLFWLSLGITFVIFFEPLYHWSIQWFEVEKMTGYSADVLKTNYHELIGYLTNPLNDSLVMSNFTSSQQGLFHFFEVKRLSLKQRRLTWLLRRPIRWLVLVPIFVCVGIASFFNTLFIKFHELFFNNDAWIFDPKKDPIILALPEEFFMVCFIVVFSILLLGLLGTNLLIENLKEI